jgi:outer membrane biosynthesis protein TonB
MGTKKKKKKAASNLNFSKIVALTFVYSAQSRNVFGTGSTNLWIDVYLFPSCQLSPRLGIPLSIPARIDPAMGKSAKRERPVEDEGEESGAAATAVRSKKVKLEKTKASDSAADVRAAKSVPATDKNTAEATVEKTAKKDKKKDKKDKKEKKEKKRQLEAKEAAAQSEIEDTQIGESEGTKKLNLITAREYYGLG